MPSFNVYLPIVIHCARQREHHVVVACSDQALEVRERAVVEFHEDGFEHRHRRADLEKVQNYFAVAEEVAVGDFEREDVTDLAGSAGDEDVNRISHVKTAN